MIERAYFELVAKQNLHVREMLAIYDVAAKHGLEKRVEGPLANMVSEWEHKFPRLSATLKRETMK